MEAQARETIADLRAKIVELEQVVRTMVEAKLSGLKDGEPGKSVTLSEMAPLITVAVSEVAESISEQIQAAVAALPAPQPGRDADPDLVRTLIADEVKTAVDALPAAKDGQSITVEDCRPIVEEALVTAVAALRLPQDGKSVTVEECLPVIEEALQRAVAAMPAPKDGKDGKLPIVKAWSDTIHYATDVVAHEGSSYQAARDTGKAPPHEDWICIAQAGRDGRTPTPRGLWTETETYNELDIAMLNGSSFIALKDAPGPCPGVGWRLLTTPGKIGKPGPKGDKGDKGPQGPPSAAVIGLEFSEGGLLVLRNGDGTVVECDLYPVLSKVV